MASNVSDGTLLDGRVRYRQPRDGYRTGIEPVLLAAFVPARAGERVLEAGCGAGAGLLCLAARVPGVTGLGVERDPTLAALARENAVANGVAGVAFEHADILAWRADAGFDHAMANPPWHEAGGTPPASGGRVAAKVAPPGTLRAWPAAMARGLRPRGTLSLIVPAATLTAAAAGLREAGCGAIVVMPLWPRAGQEARLVLLRGTRGARGGDTLHPGLVLHDGNGFSAAAERCLRGGAPIL